MIIDTLDNADKYNGLHPRFAKAFEFIKSQNLEAIEPGKFEIDGRNIHASVSLKDGVKREEAKAEAHNNYIDIQVCPTGKEELGWKPRNKAITPKEEYNAEKNNKPTKSQEQKKGRRKREETDEKKTNAIHFTFTKITETRTGLNLDLYLKSNPVMYFSHITFLLNFLAASNAFSACSIVLILVVAPLP